MPDAKPPEVSPAWLWPKEWTAERAYWRDVTARTLAGILTVTLVSVPTLIFAATTGALTPDQVVPPILGLVLLLLLAAGYFGSLRLIEWRKERRVARANTTFETKLDSPSLTEEERVRLDAERTHEIDLAYKQGIRRAIGSMIASVLLGIAFPLIPFLIALK